MAGIIQSRSASDNSGAGVVALAFNSNNTAGHLLVVVGVGLTSGKTFTVADTQLNTYQSLTAITDGSSISESQLFFCLNCKSGANTVTFDSTAAVNVGIAIHEFSPVKSQTGSASATGAGSALDSGALVVTSGSLLFGFAGGIQSANSATIAGSGWTLAEGANIASPAAFLATEWKIASPSSVNATLTTTISKGGTLAWEAEIAGFPISLVNSTSLSGFTFTPQWTSW